MFESKEIEQELETMPSDETIFLLKEKGILKGIQKLTLKLNIEDYASCDSSLTVSVSYSDKEIVWLKSEKLSNANHIESDAFN